MSAKKEIITKEYEKVYSLFPTQMKFMESTKKEVMYCGGVGVGKSYILCFALIKQASLKGTNCLLVRKTLKDLKESTLITLLKGDGKTEPVLIPGSYKYDKSRGVIQLLGGGCIWLRGLDDPQRIMSTQYSCIAMDEAIEFTETDYEHLLTRLRGPIGTRQIYLTTNPATPSHHLYQRFFKDRSEYALRNREVFTANIYENSELPKDYIENMEHIGGDKSSPRYQRLILGQWTTLDNVVYDNFNREIHVRDIMPIEYDRFYIGLDFGFKDPTVNLVIGQIGNRLFILDEFYKRGCLIDQIVSQCKFYYDTYKRPPVIYDPSAAMIGASLENAGMKTVKGNNDVRGGIERVRNYFNLDFRQEPCLVISSKCVNLIRELENYQYIEGTEEPEAGGDHCLDSLRYVINFIEDSKLCNSASIYFGEEEEENNVF